MDQAAEAKPDTRTCSCHPDDAPFKCPRKFATRHCWRADAYSEACWKIAEIENSKTPDRETLSFLKRVERALDGTF